MPFSYRTYATYRIFRFPFVGFPISEMYALNCQIKLNIEGPRVRSEKEHNSRATHLETSLMLSLMCSVLLTAGAQAPPTASAVVHTFINPPSKLTTNFGAQRKPTCRNPATSCCGLDNSIFWRVTHYMAGAFDPNGSGIVLRGRTAASLFWKRGRMIRCGSALRTCCRI